MQIFQVYRTFYYNLDYSFDLHLKASLSSVVVVVFDVVVSSSYVYATACAHVQNNFICIIIYKMYVGAGNLTLKISIH